MIRAFSLVLGAVLILILSMSVFVVNQAERAVVTRFGQIVASDVQPGLAFKLPVIDQVHRFDARRRAMDMSATEYLTSEKKRLTVDSYVMWRIKDVGKYFVATRNGDRSRAEHLLESRINSGLRDKFGERTVVDVVSGERDELMSEITEEINQGNERQEGSQSQLGIEVVDVRVRKIDLPEQASESVFNRMRAEREREAREHRSKGKEESERIRAEADRDTRLILAAAHQQSLEIRGEGDAKASAIYASGYSKDPEFFKFYRSLSAYRTAFSENRDVLVLSPDSEFFKYFGTKKP